MSGRAERPVERAAESAVERDGAARALAPAAYWERRARRYGRQGAGLGAVCSYGMPAFYNRSIEICQRLALRRWLSPPAGATALDLGCGVGRWSLRLAARGALVTGVDVSATMAREARARAAEAGLGDRCRFLVQDLAELDAGGPFDLVLSVTVLQHILDPERLHRAAAGLAGHLGAGGRAVVLEAAPTRSTRSVHRCDSQVFRARSSAFYRRLFASVGLRVDAVTGVDPVPLKTLLLPHYRALPPLAARSLLAAATAISLPIDAAAGRRWVAPSWHKVFVLSHDRGAAGRAAG